MSISTTSVRPQFGRRNGKRYCKRLSRHRSQDQPNSLYAREPRSGAHVSFASPFRLVPCRFRDRPATKLGLRASNLARKIRDPLRHIRASCPRHHAVYTHDTHHEPAVSTRMRTIGSEPVWQAESRVRGPSGASEEQVCFQAPKARSGALPNISNRPAPLFRDGHAYPSGVQDMRTTKARG